MHDPLCVFYMMTRNSPSWMLAPRAPEDIRIETAGQWTRGMHTIDRRNRKKGGKVEQVMSPGAAVITNPMENIGAAVAAVDIEDAPGDHGGWLSVSKGNRINRIVGTPGEDLFGPYLIDRVFGFSGK
jgi:hypothetical protein